jgi:hypothetical protein
MLRTALTAGVIALSAGAASAQVKHVNPVNPGELKWGPAPAIFPKGAQMAVLSGDPSKPGIFVARLRMPAGWHPTDEYITVISGDFRMGMGDKLVPGTGTVLGAGGFAEAPKGMNHFGMTRNGAVVQVAAEGPFTLVYANPKDDPTHAGHGR